MQITLYTANCTGNVKNCVYPNKCLIDNEEDFIAAVAADHVTARFKNSYRSIDNFLISDCDVLDCDNDHSDSPDEWITPEEFLEMIPDVSVIIVPSRHSMMVKDGKTARPRFHVYFPHDPISSAAECAELKTAIQAKFPFFDGNALDAARFIFGNVSDEIIWREGEITIDCIVKAAQRSIPQGQRNSTMSRFAGRVVKRYGATEQAHQIFLDEAAKCDPPLDDAELSLIWGSACKFAAKVQAQDGYVPPEEYNDDFGRQSLKPEDYSDIGEAKVLAREYGTELCYTAATDYLRYDGVAWIESKQRAVGAMEEFLDLQLEDAKDELDRARRAMLNAGVSEDAVKAGGKTLEKSIGGGQHDAFAAYLSALSYLNFVMKRRDMKYIVSGLQAAKPMLEVHVNDLDRDEFLLNTPVGTYYLPDGMAGLKDHDPGNYITKMTAVAPGDEGRDLWEDALDTIFCGDTELISYVQQVVGMAAVGKVYVEALIIAYGEGRNGKSTFWNTIARVLGTYSGNLSADTLTVGCRRNVKPEMAEAKGKRLIIASELEEGMRLNTSVVKQMCSTDEIFAEKKYKDPFSFRPSHTLVLYTNHLPRVGANDPGTWRRLIVIPFGAKIDGAGDIKNYADHLYNNAAPYILAWIIEGAQEAIRRNFHIPVPKIVEDAIKSYREDNDWLGHFISECCEVDRAYKCRSGELYRTYRNYCAQTGDYTRSTTDFYNAIETCGYRRKKQKDGSWVYGMCLKATDFLD